MVTSIILRSTRCTVAVASRRVVTARVLLYVYVCACVSVAQTVKQNNRRRRARSTERGGHIVFVFIRVYLGIMNYSFVLFVYALLGLLAPSSPPSSSAAATSSSSWRQRRSSSPSVPSYDRRRRRRRRPPARASALSAGRRSGRRDRRRAGSFSRFRPSARACLYNRRVARKTHRHRGHRTKSVSTRSVSPRPPAFFQRLRTAWTRRGALARNVDRYARALVVIVVVRSKYDTRDAVPGR